MILKGAITGTPRSGTTIFSAMLNQHPDLYVPFQSPLVELLWRQYELYTDRNFSIELSSVEVRQGMSQFFRGTADAFFRSCSAKTFALDKSGHWSTLANRNMFLDVFGEDLPLIYVRRPFAEIEQSFRDALPSTMDAREVDQFISKARVFAQTTELSLTIRSKSWLVLEYEDWIREPENTLRDVETFLDLAPHRYDLSAPSIDTSGASYVLNHRNLHEVRPMI